MYFNFPSINFRSRVINLKFGTTSNFELLVAIPTWYDGTSIIDLLVRYQYQLPGYRYQVSIVLNSASILTEFWHPSDYSMDSMAEDDDWWQIQHGSGAGSPPLMVLLMTAPHERFSFRARRR